MTSADAGSDVVQRLDSLYEFERAPVTEDRLEPGSYFAGLFSGEHVAATEFVIGALLVSFGASATDIVLGLLLGNLLAVLSWTFVCAPIAVGTRLTLYWYLRRIAGPGGDAPLQPLQRRHVLHPRGGDDHRLGLGRAPALRHPRADEVVPGGHALRPRRARGGGGGGDPRHPRLQAPRPVRGRLLALDGADVRRGGGRHAAGARHGPPGREDPRPRRPVDDRQPDDLEGRLRALVRRHRLLARGGLRLDLQPGDARGPVGHGDLPLREEVELRALLRLRHVRRPLHGLDLRGDHGGGGRVRGPEAARAARLGGRRQPGAGRLRRPRGRDRGLDDGEPHALPRGPRPPGGHPELAALEGHPHRRGRHDAHGLLAVRVHEAPRLRRRLRPAAHAGRGDRVRRALDLPEDRLHAVLGQPQGAHRELAGARRLARLGRPRRRGLAERVDPPVLPGAPRVGPDRGRLHRALRRGRGPRAAAGRGRAGPAAAGVRRGQDPRAGPADGRVDRGGPGHARDSRRPARPPVLGLRRRAPASGSRASRASRRWRRAADRRVLRRRRRRG